MNLVQVSFIAIGVVGVLGVLGMVAIVSGRTPRSFNWRKNVDKKALKVDKSKTSFLAPEEPESVEEVNITEEDSSEALNVILREIVNGIKDALENTCLLYTSPSPRDLSTSRMPASA